MLQKIRNNKGFSLIELLGVLIILSVLFGLVIPHFVKFDSSAKDVQVKYEEKAVERRDIFKLYGGEDSLIGEEEEEKK